LTKGSRNHMTPRIIVVKAPCRLHFGLVSMTRDGSRAYGGVGLGVQPESTIVVASLLPSGKVQVQSRSAQLSKLLATRLRALDLVGVNVTVERSAEPHIGFGSKTALLLATIEAATRALGRFCSEEWLVRMSGRAGASGIGAKTYFTGGLVADVGHDISAIADFVPSSQRSGHTPPAMLFRHDWPGDWGIAVIRHRRRRGHSGASETHFFQSVTPLSRVECALSCLALMLELPAAVVDHDFTGLRFALAQSRLVGFKARELVEQPETEWLLRKIDAESDLAASMSSMGPSVVVVGDVGLDSVELSRRLGLESEWLVESVKAANHGRYIEAVG